MNITETEKEISVIYSGETLAIIPIAEDISFSSEHMSLLEGLGELDFADMPEDVAKTLSFIFNKISGVNKIIPIEHDENVKGISNPLIKDERVETTIYLNRGMLDDLLEFLETVKMLKEKRGYISFNDLRQQNPAVIAKFLGFIHELGESFASLPDSSDFKALTRHTFMRGVGKDVRKAFNMLFSQGKINNETEAAELIELLDKSMKDSDFVMSSDRRSRLKKGKPALFEAEIDLILYNSTQLTDGEKRVGRTLLFGVQDHIDPSGNLDFTKHIQYITDDLRRGCLNIFLISQSGVPGANTKQTKFAQKTKRIYRKKYGINTDVSHFTSETLISDIEKAVEHAEAAMAKDRLKLPKIDVYCTNQEELDLINAYLKKHPELTNMIMISKDFSQDGVIPEEVKIITIGSMFMNDKRLKEFGRSDEDLFESRKALIDILTSSGMLFINEKDDIETVSGINILMQNIWEGKKALIITKIDYEQIRDWEVAQNEVLRSL